MLVQLDDRQVNILVTIMSYVTVNGKQVSLSTITETLNAMAGLSRSENSIISSETLQAFGNIFGELQINNINVPIRDIIAINNAFQIDVSKDYEKIPDIVKQVQKEATTEKK